MQEHPITLSIVGEAPAGATTLPDAGEPLESHSPSIVLAEPEPDAVTAMETEPALESVAEPDPDPALEPTDSPLALEPAVAPFPSAISAPAAWTAPLPKPRPPIAPERCEGGWRTVGVTLTRAIGSRSYYIHVAPPDRKHTIYLSQANLNHLTDLATGLNAESTRVWEALCSIPMERPHPNRHLAEELKALLTAFAPEIRR